MGQGLPWREEDKIVRVSMRADANFQPVGSAIEHIAKIQSGGEQPIGDAHAVVGQDAAHRTSPRAAGVEAEGQVVIPVGGRGSVLKIALVGKSRALSPCPSKADQ
ncbi:MAG: hypothetical protein JWR69_3228 [Pedosphaera sp.]|nr:hypothetical protein [Pedosphaera sp.]